MSDRATQHRRGKEAMHVQTKLAYRISLLLAFMLMQSTAHSQVRSSDNYSISFDLITAGGSLGISPDYAETICSIGQDVAYAWSTSDNYIDENGFVPSAHYVPVIISRFAIE